MNTSSRSRIAHRGLRSVVLLLLSGSMFSGCAGTISECVLVQPQYERRVLRDFQYARSRVFDLARVSDSVYWQPGDRIIAFKLYHVNDSGDSWLTPATVYVDWMNRTKNPDSVLGVIEQKVNATVDSLNFSVVCPPWFESSPPRAYAYYMAVKTPSGIREFGDSSSTPVRLQMLKPKRLEGGHPLWNAEWKNVYDLGVRDFQSKYHKVWIYKGPFGAENHQRSGGEGGEEGRGSYVSILGLDRVNVSGDIGPDGNIDRNSALMFAHFGLLAFPDRCPFASSTLQERAVAIYETSDLAELAANSKYSIETTASLVPSHVRLGRLNLIEGSERIYLWDSLLVRGVHYEIDYALGSVSLLVADDPPEGILRIFYRFQKPEYVTKRD